MADLGVRSKCVCLGLCKVWRGLINWVSILLQIFVQILSGTSSLFSYIVGLGSRHPSILASSSPSFKPLPVDSSSVATTHVNVHDTVNDGGSGDEHAIEKLTVVLDLDETLVCAYETSSLPALLHTQAIEAGLKWFELECVSADKLLKLKKGMAVAGKINVTSVEEKAPDDEPLVYANKLVAKKCFQSSSRVCKCAG